MNQLGFEYFKPVSSKMEISQKIYTVVPWKYIYLQSQRMPEWKYIFFIWHSGNIYWATEVLCRPFVKFRNPSWFILLVFFAVYFHKRWNYFNINFNFNINKGSFFCSLPLPKMLQEHKTWTFLQWSCIALTWRFQNVTYFHCEYVPT